MSLLSRLAEKSWLTPGAEGFDEPADYRPTALAVWLYLYFAVMAVIFSLTVAAYLMRMGLHEAMGHGAGDWRPMPEPALLWVNTAILALSSMAWEVARRGTAAPDRIRLGVIVGGLLGIAFLFGQILLWRHYYAAGYYLSANPANAFFYLLTAIHGLHLIGGLAAWLRVLARPRLSSIKLCALYWHSLLLIWVLLAGLLLLT
ncbi:cytochrome c oxidase subunit 3 [Rhizorhapis sp. SPR117]|uniref:cytochrome c oxidase subunit 3 n=1 Tax=Rhizorhapis sp. SPR117 TaxID=2912611 RepID=UPI001F1D90F2|nr:heme-copper oxidase subunit III [Rhizorhapis sp. SPR117]